MICHQLIWLQARYRKRRQLREAQKLLAANFAALQSAPLRIGVLWRRRAPGSQGNPQADPGRRNADAIP